MKKTMFAAAAAAVLCAAPPAALAQDAGAPVHRNLITANPIGILANYYNVEFERALSDVTSVSLAGERTTVDDADLSAADVRFRYYPQARMFSGLAPRATMARTVAVQMPPAAPFQPAWAAPTTPADRSANSTGAQSAVTMPRPIRERFVTSPSASGGSSHAWVTTITSVE